MNKWFRYILSLQIVAALTLTLAACSSGTNPSAPSSAEKHSEKSAITTQAKAPKISDFRQKIDGATIAKRKMSIADHDQINKKLKELTPLASFVKVTPKKCQKMARATMLKGIDPKNLDSFVVAGTKDADKNAVITYHASTKTDVDLIVDDYAQMQDNCKKMTLHLPHATVEQRNKIEELSDFENSGLIAFLTTIEQDTTVNGKRESETVSTLRLIYPAGESITFSASNAAQAQEMAKDTLSKLAGH